MDDEKLKAITVLAEAATPGPWRRVDNAHDHWGMREVVGPAVVIRGFSIATNLSAAEGAKVALDCNFIAAFAALPKP